MLDSYSLASSMVDLNNYILESSTATKLDQLLSMSLGVILSNVVGSDENEDEAGLSEGTNLRPRVVDVHHQFVQKTIA